MLVNLSTTPPFHSFYPFELSLRQLLDSLRESSADLVQAQEAIKEFKDSYYNFLATEVRKKRLTEEGFLKEANHFEKLWKDVRSTLVQEGCFASLEEKWPHQAASLKKPKILVLMCEGGGGHISAAESVQQALGDAYTVESVNVLSEIVGDVDTLRKFTCTHFSAEDLYNYCLRNGHHRTISGFMATFGGWIMKTQKRRIEDLFKEYLLKEQQRQNGPDLIISTIPFINCGLVFAAHALKIPYLLLPTDLDASTYLNGFQELDLDLFTGFKFALLYDDPDLRFKVIKHSHLKAEQLEISGFPVRQKWEQKATSEEIKSFKEEHGIKEGYKTLSLVMGARGTRALLDQALCLASIPLKEIGGIPLQANILVGKNEKLACQVIKALQNLGAIEEKTEANNSCKTFQCANGNLIHVRLSTPKIAEIAACSDLFISKTGSCSVNEPICMGKPLLLDYMPASSARHLWWETFNVRFVKKHKMGDSYTSLEELKAKTIAYLMEPQIEKTNFTPPHFTTNIQKLVRQMLS